MQELNLETNDQWGRLMRLALGGDQLAYSELLSAITPHVRAVVRRLLVRSGRGQAEVEDIVQETLLAVHLKRASWDRSMPFRPWLNAVARYKAIDVLRRMNIRGEVDIDGMDDVIAAPEEDIDGALDRRRLLASLDGRPRLIVEQFLVVGRSASEVGDELGMSEGAVRVALHRALKKLARNFKRQRQ